MLPETAIFLHIQKAAGTTLLRIIERHYRTNHLYEIHPEAGPHRGPVSDFERLDGTQRRQYRMVMGHLWFGLHTQLAQPSTYFTILREPVARVLSFYHFVRSNPEHYLHDYLAIGDASLERAIREKATVSFDNLQTRMISGLFDTIPYGECDEAMLELAKSNLRQHFAVVGVAERFDEVLLLLQRRFGWRYVHYTRHNVGKNRPKPNAISPATKTLIAEHNHLDLALYQYAQQLCAEQIAAQDAYFYNDLARFRQRNKLLSPIHAAYWRLRQISVREMLKRERAG